MALDALCAQGLASGDFCSAATPGDYDHNGQIEANDYVKWRDTLGSTTHLDADGNRNGIIDEGDYDAWKTNFGAIAAGQRAARQPVVPEPATWLVAFACGVIRRCPKSKRPSTV